MPILFMICFLIGNIFPKEKEESTSPKRILQEAFKTLNANDKKSDNQFYKSPTKTFKSAVENFITKHVRAIYSDGIDGLGTATIDNMKTTSTCIAQKIIKELEFLVNHDKAFDTFLIQLWLGDAEEDFWPFLKKISDPKKIWPEIKRLTQEKLKLQLPDKKNIPAVINWSENFKLPFSKKSPTPHTTKFYFTVNEVGLLLALEDSVFAEFSKIMELFKNKPLALKTMTEGHIAWLDLRASLLSFYIHLGIEPNIIKIRMACLHLSQFYFYKHFVAYFTKQPHETRCLVLAPREHYETYDCTIVRKPKNLPSELPCFPK